MTTDDQERTYLTKLCRGTGYQIAFDDQWHIPCRHGHIYADRGALVASFDHATRAQRQAALRLGEAVADGDLGELSVRFHPSCLDDFARLLLPRQSRLAA